MPTFSPRLAVALVALATIGGTMPLAAQAAPAMATVYLKEGGVIQGLILNENDPNGVRIKSQKSGTVFLLKTIWIDSIVKAPTAPAALSVAAAPAAASSAPAAGPSAPMQSRPEPDVPVVDALDPPSAPVPAAAPAPAPETRSQAEKKPAKFAHWYVGGGGAAPTGDMSNSTGIGFNGMLAYAAGMGSITQLRVGSAGTYWSVSDLDANVYDITGTFDLLIGKRIPSFIAPYGLIGGVGGVRSVSAPAGFTGSTDPLYGGRVGAGLNSSRLFLEVSYQKVWVEGGSTGYVPFVFGFRF